MNSIQKFGTALLLILLGILIVPSYMIAQELESPPPSGWGYVWADNPTESRYEPNLIYSYNSSGKEIEISRRSTGRYKVTFYGLGGNGIAGGNVQVTAYGPGNENCKVEYWISGGPDFIVQVRCFTASGKPVDTRFSLRVDWPDKY
jgi:hypothetical protein